MPRCPSPSHAIIDLRAIAANLAVVRKRAGDRKVLFAVKADAYGHGAVEVSRYVEKHRYADWLAVATVAEGQELVEAGITGPHTSMVRHPRNRLVLRPPPRHPRRCRHRRRPFERR